MFKNSGGYFLSFGTNWELILKLLNLLDTNVENWNINPKFELESVNANNGDGFGINRDNFLLEYLIFPNLIRNGEYDYSAIYDQQLKRFVESANINYGTILTNEATNTSIFLLFKSSVPGKKSNENAGFFLTANENGTQRTIAFLFNKKYMNLQNAHAVWGKPIQYEVLEIIHENGLTGESGKANIKYLEVDSKDIWLNLAVQSQDDAQMGPFDMDLYNFFKE